MIAGLFLAVLALILDGPGSRWIVKSVLTSQLEKRGLSGEIEIAGHLHSGYSLRNASFTGTGLIRLLSFDDLSVDYRLHKLVGKKLDGLSGRNIRVVLHPKAKEKNKDDEPLKIDIPEETVRDIRALVLPVALDFRAISVEIRRDALPPLTVGLAGLSHRPGENATRISGLASNILGERGLPSQDITLEWAVESLTVSRLLVLPAITVESLRLAMPPADPSRIVLSVSLAGAMIDANADETGSARLALADDAVDLREVLAGLPVDLDLSGTLDTLVLDVDDLFAPPEHWRGDLQLDATALRYKRFLVKAMSAEGHVTRDGIELLATLGPEKGTELTIKTPLPDGEGDSLFANHPIDLNLEIRSLDESLAWIVKALNEDPDKPPPALPTGSFSLSGRLQLGEDGKLAKAAANWHSNPLAYQGATIPPLQGSATLAGDKAEIALALAKPAEGESVTLSGTARLDAGTYEARLAVHLPDPTWVNAFLPGDSPLWKPTGPVGIDWEGSGSYKEMTHKGSATVAELALTAPNDTVTSIGTAATYEWPGVVTLDSLLVRNGDLKIGGSLLWEGGVLKIPKIGASDASGPLLTIGGSAPLAASLRSLQDLLDQEQEFDLKIDAAPFALSRLQNLLPLPIPEGYAASLESDLRITGSAAHPKLDGHLEISEVRIPKPEGLPSLTARIEFATVNDTLSARGTLTEPGGDILKLDAELPLTIREWAANPERLKEAPFKAHAVADQFDLARIEKFVPQIAGAKGTLGIDVTAGGSVAEPKLTGNIAIVVDRFPLPDTPFRAVENTKLLVRFEDRRIFLDPSPIHAAGGKIILSGEANLEGEEPTFTLNLNADHALLWRDDAYSARANAKLVLAGTPSAAKITGSIDLVESLFYKEIEIIPIGVPTTSAPKPKLPKIDGPSGGGPLVPAPAPVADWTLDVKIRTADPILIRGNLATGSVSVNAAVGGTIATPRPSGSIQLHDLKADLPFSKLTVPRGEITLRPDAPLDPTLDIRGTSTVNKTQIAMLIFGPLSKPKHTLSSDPPLPENEILTLVATGSTTSDLEDTNTASMKAFQLMIEEFRRRSTKPGGNSAFNTIMKELEDVELNVGENDPFTGRKFSSATLELTDKYYLSAGFDAEGNTRTSIIYSLRFR